MRSWQLCALIAAAGCSRIPSEVSFRGTVFESHLDDAAPLSAATVTIFDDDGTRYARATTSDQGEFSVSAPVGVVVFAEFARDGFARASFLGVTGTQEVQRVEKGAVYGFSVDEFAEWEDLFAGCPGIGTGGAVLGEVRFGNIADPDTGEHPLATTATAEIVTRRGESFDACYLDNDGLGYVAESEATGHSGRFAVFGVPAGVHTLTIGYSLLDGEAWIFDDYPVKVPDGGVAPRIPALAEWGL